MLCSCNHNCIHSFQSDVVHHFLIRYIHTDCTSYFICDISYKILIFINC